MIKSKNPYVSSSDNICTTENNAKKCKTCRQYEIISILIIVLIAIFAIGLCVLEAKNLKAHINIQLWEENKKVWDSWK